jgi:hypothetical protein
MWESPTHWPPGSGRPLRRSSPPTHRSAGSSDEDLRSASAIVTAAEPIWATFPARASKSGCRAANRNPPPRRQKQGAGPAGGDGNGADRAPRCERSISAQCERPTPGPRRARCGRRAGVHPPPGRAGLAPASGQEQRRRADRSYPCEGGRRPDRSSSSMALAPASPPRRCFCLDAIAKLRVARRLSALPLVAQKRQWHVGSVHCRLTHQRKRRMPCQSPGRPNWYRPPTVGGSGW